MMSRALSVLLLLSLVPALGTPVDAAEPPPVIAEFDEYLVIDRVGKGGRRPVHTDAIEKSIVDGSWETPEPGDAVDIEGIPRIWQTRTAGEDGWLQDDLLRGGYAVTVVDRSEAGPAMLEARGHSLVYVNGEPRPGDPYANGTLRLPVMLDAGPNEFLFSVGRGRLNARLVDVPRDSEGDPKTFFFTGVDDTIPDAVAGLPIEAPAGVVVANIGDEWAPNTSILVTGPGGEEVAIGMPSIPPGSVRKIPIRLLAVSRPGAKTVDFKVELIDAGRIEPLDSRTVQVRVVEPGQTRKVTFRSEIDDTVQFYGLVPSSAPPPAEGDPSGGLGLILSLHGAGVNARGQAGAYAPKEFAHVVTPTNRREFGFDWEDWGRLDALEVLEHARRMLGTQPARQWVTGHSMGGHGTWHAAAHHPDLFAAAAPSAGWISFDTYGSERLRGDDSPSSIPSIMARAANPSDTLLLKNNLDELGIYVLHGDADDNVPVDQARTMREHLGGFHPDFAYYEQPGAGHWWGNRCVDWPPLMQFLESKSRTFDSDLIDFTTISPGINAGHDWFEIAQQQVAFAPSRVTGIRDREAGRIDLDTENVERLKIDLDAGPRPWTVVLDGQVIPSNPRFDQMNGITPAIFNHTGEEWRRAATFNPKEKNAGRSGGFKDAFRRTPLLVVGTLGSDEEDRITLARAILDAETFLYRGNGGFDVMLDTDFDVDQHPRRNIILYGNMETNAAWSTLLGDDPLQIDREGIRFGELKLEGDDLAVLAIRPRPRWASGSIGIVAGTGPRGLRLTERIPYFRSGVHYPDLVVFGPESIAPGTEGLDGIRAAAYFENDWMLEDDFAIREPNTAD
ncbi:MAG: prolyl oligopeptidase family serine peptidase [Phycisphaerales bacterium]|nr:prolyl oligopeptidase family serine peptidase [Phycisphaerales bacterium]